MLNQSKSVHVRKIMIVNEEGEEEEMEGEEEKNNRISRSYYLPGAKTPVRYIR